MIVISTDNFANKRLCKKFYWMWRKVQLVFFDTLWILYMTMGKSQSLIQERSPNLCFFSIVYFWGCKWFPNFSAPKLQTLFQAPLQIFTSASRWLLRTVKSLAEVWRMICSFFFLGGESIWARKKKSYFRSLYCLTMILTPNTYLSSI